MKSILRFLDIGFTLARYRIYHIATQYDKLSRYHLLTYLNPMNWQRASLNRGVAIREALESLGPIFVKFGQALSTRRDLLPDDIADELAKLQDSVPPFPSQKAVQIIESELGQSVQMLFQSFDEVPLASASIAQVHTATLQDGQDVIVKVLRPNMRRMIARDVKLLYAIARVVQRVWSEGYRLRPVEVVREFEYTIMDELNLVREAANASQLKRNFEHTDILYVPTVYWEYTKRSVLVMERIHGVPIGNTTLLRSKNVNMKLLAERGVNIFYRQVFEDSFFHADMHPGNIFVDISNPEDPKYIAVDFGIMGALQPEDQRYLAENMLAFFKRDYRRVAMLHVESGWVPKDTRIDQFEAAIRTVCEPIFEKPLKDISFGYLLVNLFQTASRFNMEIQPQLLLLQKTLLNIEGLGRQLYPDLDLWATGKPFLENWMKQRVSPKKLIKKLFEQAPFIIEQLTDAPHILSEIKHKLFKTASVD